MGFRISTFSTYRRVLQGLRTSQVASLRAQEQLSSGKRILRPSDDPTGAARAIRLERQIADMDRYRRAIAQGQRTVDAGSAALTDASTLISQARELILQGMNGTLTQDDRNSIADQFDLIRNQMLDLANDRSGDLYVFGGTQTDRKPFVEMEENGRTTIQYVGDDGGQRILVGSSVDVAITLEGSEAFARFEPTGTVYGGLTGVAAGTDADEGRGYSTLSFRHDQTVAPDLATVGIALVNGGNGDTLLGDNALVVDATAGTIRLGTGPAVEIPTPLPADLVLTNEIGAELHLDLTSFTGADLTTTVTGEGSVSLDGTNYVQFDPTETNFELVDEEADRVIHVDLTNVKRAGDELVEFGGTTNVFDLLQQTAVDLRNEDGLTTRAMLDRLNYRLEDLDRHHQNVLIGAGTLGARSQRLDVSDSRSADVEVHLQGLLSEVADADLAEVATELTRIDYLLQLTQASSASLLQTSLLNYLG